MIGIIDFGSSKVPDILKSVVELGYEGEVCVHSHKLEVQSGKWDKLIFSGAPILLSQIEDSQQYIDFAKEVLELNIPVLGICFGHQIIGLAHGTECFMGEENRAAQIIYQKKADPIFQDLEVSFEMQQDHCEYIDLPKKFVHLGCSKVTQNEVMKHSSKPIYGCQFHPEVSRQNGMKFIENFLRIN